MVPVVAFVGYHNSGKTTFATEVVKILRSRGYKVAVLKSTKHTNLIKDKKGKDSYRYREAGADAVGIVSPHELILFQDVERERLNLKFLSFSLFDDYDIVICEGFKGSDVPKIAVTRKEVFQEDLLRNVNGIVAVVSDFKVKGFKNFSIERPEEVADFLEKEFIENREDGFPDEVELFVNENRVKMKYFVRKTLKGIIEGFIKSLKEIENVRKIDIRIAKINSAEKHNPKNQSSSRD